MCNQLIASLISFVDIHFIFFVLCPYILTLFHFYVKIMRRLYKFHCEDESIRLAL